MRVVLLFLVLSGAAFAGDLLRKPFRAPIFRLSDEARFLARSAGCTCAVPSFCAPLSTPKPAKELFVYSPDEQMFASYNWTSMTTIVTYSMPHPAMICYAHQRGVRVVWAFGTDWSVASDPAKRAAYAAGVANIVSGYGLDGINMDFEEPPPAPLFTNYVTALLFAVSDLVRAGNANAQISLCFSSFDSFGGTYYTFDFAGLLPAVDFLLAMMYDMSSSAVGANSLQRRINSTFFGLFQLASMAPEKLVLAFPWYGYEYRCLNGTVADGWCMVAGSGEVCYQNIMQILNGQSEGRYANISGVTRNLNPTNGTYASFSAVDTSDAATPHHIFVYDDPQTLQRKYEEAMKLGAKGLSVFHATCLGNSTQPELISLREAMWTAVNMYF
jgi:di-N-acetylchitobiase